ncbi:hypothetical protein B0H16DRAFT_1737707 [Mycena metata]|uniref:Uncharacterized protein n=1 Tax=Mycena metata TaxID=1033252 RepID=A0AAD7HKC4_9AGAR|nr:hypothetical protein B0H16DRAFT_1737707 [Mycena metata]
MSKSPSFQGVTVPFRVNGFHHGLQLFGLAVVAPPEPGAMALDPTVFKWFFTKIFLSGSAEPGELGSPLDAASLSNAPSFRFRRSFVFYSPTIGSCWIDLKLALALDPIYFKLSESSCQDSKTRGMVEAGPGAEASEGNVVDDEGEKQGTVVTATRRRPLVADGHNDSHTPDLLPTFKPLRRLYPLLQLPCAPPCFESDFDLVPKMKVLFASAQDPYLMIQSISIPPPLCDPRPGFALL